jgi:hypothetical protein
MLSGYSRRHRAHVRCCAQDDGARQLVCPLHCAVTGQDLLQQRRPERASRR